MISRLLIIALTINADGRDPLTCYSQASSAAADGAQVVNGGHTLVDALVRFVVFGVHHSADEKRAVREQAPAVVCCQVGECAVLLPFHSHWGLAGHRAVQHSRQPAYGQRVHWLH